VEAGPSHGFRRYGPKPKKATQTTQNDVLDFSGECFAGDNGLEIGKIKAPVVFHSKTRVDLQQVVRPLPQSVVADQKTFFPAGQAPVAFGLFSQFDCSTRYMVKRKLGLRNSVSGYNYSSPRHEKTHLKLCGAVSFSIKLPLRRPAAAPET
jgi:hypothetical protein